MAGIVIAAGLAAALPAAAQTQIGTAAFASRQEMRGAVVDRPAAERALRRALRRDGLDAREREVACRRSGERRFRCAIELRDWEGTGRVAALGGGRARVDYAVESRPAT